jgi:hypothetical protein
MANRYFNQFHFSPIPMYTSIFAKISFAGSGAPTLVTAGGISKGVASVSRTSAGKFVVTLSDTYNYLVGAKGVFVASGGAAAPNVCVDSESVASAKTVTILTQAGGVNTDPASGEVLLLEIELKNSSAF